MYIRRTDYRFRRGASYGGDCRGSTFRSSPRSPSEQRNFGFNQRARMRGRYTQFAAKVPEAFTHAGNADADILRPCRRDDGWDTFAIVSDPNQDPFRPLVNLNLSAFRVGVADHVGE